MRNASVFAVAAALSVAVFSCSKEEVRKSEVVLRPVPAVDLTTLKGVATMVASLPMGQSHLEEVYCAVGSSSGNGYDEEYTLENLLASPGAGVGDLPSGTKAGAGGPAMRDLIADYIEANLAATKSGTDVAEIVAALEESDIQIYWPYSEDWDGKTFPIVTFDPGNGGESNYGYLLGVDEAGNRTVDSVFVDEAVAKKHPVWVINRNDDSSYTPVEMYSRRPALSPGAGDFSSSSALSPSAGDSSSASLSPISCVPVSSLSPRAGDSSSSSVLSPIPCAPVSALSPVYGAPSSLPPGAGDFSSSALSPAAKTVVNRKLSIKSFEMKRNYDSWFAGASEFWVKCGTVNGFKASTEAELQNYSPSVTDMMIVVKRRDVGKPVPFDAILLTDFTDQLDKLAFLITEDDGGTITNWKCEATVKLKSKSYGFDLSIPFNSKDDIVWRGQLAASFFQSEDEVTGRFGDVVITFALE